MFCPRCHKEIPDPKAVVTALLNSIQVFRNCPALGPLADLRGTPEYTQLCEVWERNASAIYGDTPEGRPNVPAL